MCNNCLYKDHLPFVICCIIPSLSFCICVFLSGWKQELNSSILLNFTIFSKWCYPFLFPHSKQGHVALLPLPLVRVLLCVRPSWNTASLPVLMDNSFPMHRILDSHRFIFGKVCYSSNLLGILNNMFFCWLAHTLSTLHWEVPVSGKFSRWVLQKRVVFWMDHDCFFLLSFPCSFVF